MAITCTNRTAYVDEPDEGDFEFDDLDDLMGLFDNHRLDYTLEDLAKLLGPDPHLRIDDMPLLFTGLLGHAARLLNAERNESMSATLGFMRRSFPLQPHASARPVT
jgi:hypothetical protein